jgi:hypothetical protein
MAFLLLLSLENYSHNSEFKEFYQHGEKGEAKFHQNSQTGIMIR